MSRRPVLQEEEKAMCYRGCRWEDHDGECEWRGDTPPCERGEEDDYDEEEENPDEAYDTWREAEAFGE